MEKQRDNARTILLRALHQATKCPCDSQLQPCEKWKNAQPTVLNRILGQGYSFSTFHAMNSIKNCYTHLESIDPLNCLIPEDDSQSCGAEHPGIEAWPGNEWNAEVLMGREVREVCRGLCLDCITEGKETADECNSRDITRDEFVQVVDYHDEDED